MRNIRIAIFGMNKSIGGIEKYLQNLILSLEGKHISFDIILWHDSEPLEYEEQLKAKGIRFYRELYRLREYRKPGAINVIQLFDRHPEWNGIYLNTYRIGSTYLLLKEASRRELPYRIIHSHNNTDINGFRLKEFIWKLLFFITNRHVVTHRFACSVDAGRWMFGKMQFNVIPNAVDFEKFRPDLIKNQTMRQQFHIEDKEIIVGFCGRFCQQKNLEKVLDVFRCLHSKEKLSKLLLVGDGELMNEVQQLSRDYGIYENVIFAGSQLDPSPFYQMMDCLLLPSHYEGFGIVLLEAQAVGIRCYTSDGVVPREANLTNRVTYLNLNSASEVWADKMIEDGFDHKDCMDILLHSKYSLDNLGHIFMDSLMHKDDI